MCIIFTIQEQFIYTRTVYLYTTAQTLTIQEVIRSQKFWSK